MVSESRTSSDYWSRTSPPCGSPRAGPGFTLVGPSDAANGMATIVRRSASHINPMLGSVTIFAAEQIALGCCLPATLS